MSERSYVLKFAQDLGELIEAAIRARNVLDPLTPAAMELDAALEPFEGRSVPEAAPAVEEPSIVKTQTPLACPAFRSWGGINCEECGCPAWQHAEQEIPGTAESPFGDEGVKTEPWTGQMARVREHYLKGGGVRVREDRNGGYIVQLSVD